MSDENKNTSVTADFSGDLDLLRDLEKMVADDDTDRSKFIRHLVRKERARRDRIAARRLQVRAA